MQILESVSSGSSVPGEAIDSAIASVGNVLASAKLAGGDSATRANLSSRAGKELPLGL